MNWRADGHHEMFCPTGHGCVCGCPDCVTQHCGPAHRDAYRFCLTQGIAPTDRAVRAALVLLEEASCAT